MLLLCSANLFLNIQLRFVQTSGLTYSFCGTYQVKTVDGIRELQIPSGTQPGDILVMSKFGVPKLNKPNVRGDHFFTVKVTIPTRLSESERELVEDLARLQKTKGRGGSVKLRSNNGSRPQRSQDGRTTVLEKERIEVESEQEAEDGGLLGNVKNAVGSVASGALKWLKDRL